MTKQAGRQILQILVEGEPANEDIHFVEKGLQEYNNRFVPADNYQPLQVFLRDSEGSLLGGLLGETYWGWLHIRVLWIDEAVRGQRYGQQLLQAAEEEALQRGCHAAHLDTMSFQALPFYEKQGYSVFGVLDDLPVGEKRIFLSKRFIQDK
jgi:Acetyltransferases